VRGGTFTITNHGVSGSLLATPIIQQPQCAILGVGKLERRPGVVVIDGVEQIRILPKCYVTLTIDHRAIDGFQANGFLGAWVSCLEAWPRDPAV
jgi:2-oxoglutarate dehydrogenase E2 component (dihydrolipoamide succinyltransferase)